MDWRGQMTSTGRRKRLPGRLVWGYRHLWGKRNSGGFAVTRNARADGLCLGEIVGGQSLKGRGVPADVAAWGWRGRRSAVNWATERLRRQLPIGIGFRWAC